MIASTVCNIVLGFGCVLDGEYANRSDEMYTTKGQPVSILWFQDKQGNRLDQANERATYARCQLLDDKCNRFETIRKSNLTKEPPRAPANL